MTINPLMGLKDGLGVIRIKIMNVANDGLVPIINNKWLSGSVVTCLEIIVGRLIDVSSALGTVGTKLEEMDTFFDGKFAAITTAFGNFTAWHDAVENYFATDVRPRLNAVISRVEAAKGEAQAYARQLQVDTTNFFNARRAELEGRVGSVEQYRTDVENYFNQDLRPKVNGLLTRMPTRTPAEQAAYFKNLARPAYEQSMEFFLQNSLWNLRNKQVGSLEWDGIAAETTAKANAALAAANENINGLDARIAEMIAASNGRTTDLENKMPLTTAALNKRIDEANEAATEKANAALAAANENILTIKGDLGGRLSESEQITSDLKARVNKMELEIDKVAPILARLPKLPVGGG